MLGNLIQPGLELKVISLSFTSIVGIVEGQQFNWIRSAEGSFSQVIVDKGMQSYGNIGPYDRNGEEWPVYCERVELYLDANNITNEEQRRAVFLSTCGASTYQLIRSLVAPSKPTDKALDELYGIVKEHLAPAPSSIMQRYTFNARSQKEGESGAEFVAELRRIAQHCEFGTVLEDLLRDRLVCGLRDDRAQRRLLAESKLTFAKAFEIAQASELAEQGVRTLQPPVAGVNSIPKSDDRKAAVNAVNTESEDSQAPRSPVSAVEADIRVHTLFYVKDRPHPPLTLSVCLNEAKLRMEVDTGAAVSLISDATFKSLWPEASRPPLQPVASASTVSSDSGLVMTDDVLEVTPVLMQSPMSPRENIEVPGDDAACSSSNAIKDVLDPVASMVSEGSTVEKAPSEVGRNEPVSVEVSTVTSVTAVSEAVSTQAVAAKFGLHFDSRTGVLDPVALVGCRVSVSEKHDIIKLGPCQPSKHVLNHSQKSMQQHCSEQVFVHSDGVRRQWISYSVIKGALYCLPCLLFSDATLRGEHWRANQGNAFTTNGFCNWKKQYSAVLKHESSCAHRNAIVSQALFLQDDTVQQAFARADSVENARKRAIVAKNRTVLERIVKVLMLLGRQGLLIRGHREMMTDSMTNTGNFLETLKLLSTYDPPLQEHLEKIIERHQSASEGSSGQKGRGSVLTFMSYKSQNKLISIINEHITCTIVKAIHNCRAWSLMADTTPDISHHEQVSICVRIVHLNGHVSEHLLACQRAPGTTAEDLYGVIMSVLKLKDVSFDKLIAQAYDGASNMSGCYNGLQSLIQTRINPNILYVHCYAHCLNLVISDAAATSVDVVTLFGNLETLYVLFTRSQKVHGLFEEVQRSQGCAIRSLKRLNTVRWSAREMCLSTFLERYECILLTLNQIQTEVSFDLKHRSEAAGLLSSIQTREFLATAFLFQEIFAKTGPLSRYLQSVNMDYAKALAMIDSVIASLERMRSAPQDIIDIMERSVQDSSSIQWKTSVLLRTYTGEQLTLVGQVSVNVSYGGKCHRLPLLIVRGNGPSLLGRDWVSVLALKLEELSVLHTRNGDGLQGILERHADVFRDELGLDRGLKVKLHMKDSAKPRFYKARPVP
eukprot:Em0006g1197a